MFSKSRIVALSILFALVTSNVWSAEATVSLDQRQQVRQVSAKGIAFLRKMQADDGSFSAELGPGVTALVATSLMRNGVPEQDPVVAKALRYVEQFVQADGGVYNTESQFNMNNYETCLAMMCFAEAKDERFAKLLQRGAEFIKKIQWDGGLESPAFGGAGYGSHKRPDLSNTTFFIEALKTSGVSSDDKHMQDALVFVSRTQNLETEHNTLTFANKVGDGGFYYSPAAGGSSQAGETENGGLRSYASMTYAGLKSMIFAGVEKDDPRVKAAVEWISKHYDLSQNPGMGQQGLYYYYHTFAKSLDALGQTKLKDADGAVHDWRSDLIDVLSKSQQDNGSWVNETERWYEGNAELVTAYALMSLSYCD